MLGSPTLPFTIIKSFLRIVIISAIAIAWVRLRPCSSKGGGAFYTHEAGRAGEALAATGVQHRTARPGRHGCWCRKAALVGAVWVGSCQHAPASPPAGGPARC